jgi:hypothetical protein
MRSLAAAVAVLFPVAALAGTGAPGAPAASPAAACAAWTIHGARVGMTLNELKQVKAMVGKTFWSFGPKEKDLGYYAAFDDPKEIPVTVIVTKAEPRPIMEIMLPFSTAISPDDPDPALLVQSLSRKWGEPNPKRKTIGTRAFGDEHQNLGSFDTRVTTWTSRECGLAAALIEEPIMVAGKIVVKSRLIVGAPERIDGQVKEAATVAATRPDDPRPPK